MSARVRKCLKQLSLNSGENIVIGKLIIEAEIKQVSIEGKRLLLTHKEYSLFEVLLENKCKVISRSRLLDRVWGYDYEGSQRTVDVHVQTLRSKLGDYGSLIKTVRGFGYYFEMD